uniref:hypothetical protein n=1 Tax=Streptomyces fungicidicus TaxID=68203 RepID=UPI003D726497
DSGFTAYAPNNEDNSNPSYIQESGYDSGFTAYAPNNEDNYNPSYIQESGYDPGITAYAPNNEGNINPSYIQESGYDPGITAYAPNNDNNYNPPFIQGKKVVTVIDIRAKTAESISGYKTIRLKYGISERYINEKIDTYSVCKKKYILISNILEGITTADGGVVHLNNNDLLTHIYRK